MRILGGVRHVEPRFRNAIDGGPGAGDIGATDGAGHDLVPGDERAGGSACSAPFGKTSGVTNYVSKINPLLSTANCANPGPASLTSAGLPHMTVCYPQNH
jgi:hypothetical protein